MMEITFGFFFSFSVSNISGAGSAKRSGQYFGRGKALYKSEMASWYGTDISLKGIPTVPGLAATYHIQRVIEQNASLFKGDHSKVIGTMTFDSTLRH